MLPEPKTRSDWVARTAGEIGRMLNAPVEGDGSRSVNSAAPLAEADHNAISWIGNAKYAAELARTRAGVVLAPIGTKAPPGITVIRVADPDLAICTVTASMSPRMPEMIEGVHPSAQVHETAMVADGVRIGPNVVVGANARIGLNTKLHAGAYVGANTAIGDDCEFWPNVVVRERCLVGNRVVIHPNATIGADGFGYLFRDGRHVKIPQVGIVVIEDDVEIGANVTVDRARNGETRIGRGTKIDNLVQIAHNCRIGEHCVVVAQTGISGSTTLGKYVVLAGQVGVGDHLTIGDGAQVGAQAGVASDVPPGQSYWGTPATSLKDVARQVAATKKLPKLLEQVRELVKRIERLESAANDQRRGGD